MAYVPRLTAERLPSGKHRLFHQHPGSMYAIERPDTPEGRAKVWVVLLKAEGGRRCPECGVLEPMDVEPMDEERPTPRPT